MNLQTAPAAAALSLLTRHLDSLFTCENGRMVLVNEPWGSTSPAPLLYLGRTIFGDTFHRFGQNASDDFIHKAENLLRDAEWEADKYVHLLPEGRTIFEVCFCLPQFIGQAPAAESPAFAESCRLLKASEAPLLEAAFAGCGSELPSAAPYAGCFAEGQLAAICRSVRKTSCSDSFAAVHEAGIETRPAFRRRGCAGRALASWSAALLEQEIVPLYSALMENIASQQLAKKSGWIVYGYGTSIYDGI